MSNEGRGIGRVPRRGAGRGSRGKGRARARAVGDLRMGVGAIENFGVDARAAVNPRVKVRSTEDPRMEAIMRTLERIGDIIERQTHERAALIAQAAKAIAVANNNENQGQG